METPAEQPQRTLETTLAIHGVISAISDKMFEAGETFYNGEFETGLTHSAVFPEFVCQGQMVVTHLDSLVEYADLKCSEGCKREAKYAPINDPTDVTVQFEDFTINFDDLG